MTPVGSELSKRFFQNCHHANLGKSNRDYDSIVLENYRGGQVSSQKPECRLTSRCATSLSKE